MPFIPDAQSTSEPSSAKTSSSGGRFIPDGTDTLSTTPSPINTVKDASGVFGTTIDALASGIDKGDEAILNTMQGVTNMVATPAVAVANIGNKLGGGAGDMEVSQVFGDMAKNIETNRQQVEGNQQSLHGKVLENIAQLPALILMIGNPESVGLLGMKGGIEAFAGQAMLQTQPTLKGKPLTEQVGELGWVGGKAAMFGAVIGKSMTMGPVSGPALAGLYSSGQTALEGGDPNDILAGAIIGAGMTTLSNPKHLASVLTAENMGDNAATLQRGAKNALNIMAGKGPLTGAADIIGQVGADNVKAVCRLMDSSVKIEKIDEQIGQLETKAQIEGKELATMKAEQIGKAKKEAADANLANRDIIGELKTKKSTDTEQVHAELGLLKGQTEKLMEQADGEMKKGIWQTVDSLKSGKLKTMFDSMSTAFDKGIERVGTLITGEKPLTRFDMVDLATSIIEQAKEANAGLDSGSKTMRAVNDLIEQMKYRPFVGSGEVQKAVADMKAAGVPKASIDQYVGRNTKIDMAEPVSFDMAKAMLDRIKRADPLGSFEADIARQQFGAKIRQKLAENGQDTSNFDKLMSDMSSALSVKKTLTSAFQLTDKASIATPEGFGLLRDLATGKIDSGVENPAKARLLDVMQNGLTIGTEKVPGVGDLGTDLKQMGTNLETIKTKFESIGEKENATVLEIGKTFVARMAKAEAEGKATLQRVGAEHKRAMQLLSDAKKALESNTAERMKTLEGRRAQQQDLLDRKNDIAATMNSVGFGISMYAVRVGRGIRAASALWRRKNTGFGKNP